MITGPLTVADIPRVTALLELGEPWVRPRTDSDYWLYATLFSTTCRVAHDQTGSQLIAVVIGFRGQDDPDEVYIQDVMTHPDHRRTGATRTLLEQVATQGRRWGCKRMWLTSEPQNTIAHTTWLNLGFTNPPADYQRHGVHITRDLKGPSKDRAVYERRL